MNCSWTLQSSSGYIVVLTVSSLRFGTCSGSCSCGQLEAHDTSASSQTKIGSWCSLPQKSIVSDGNSMLVRLVTTATSDHTFQATYQYIKELKGTKCRSVCIKFIQYYPRFQKMPRSFLNISYCRVSLGVFHFELGRVNLKCIEDFSARELKNYSKLRIFIT